MVNILKTNKIDSKLSTVFIHNKLLTNEAYGISKEQHAKLVAVNKENPHALLTCDCVLKTVFIIIPSPKNNVYTELNSIRKKGTTICNTLNNEKAATIQIENDTLNSQYSLALAEGIALSNYQFNKYLTKKKNNTLTKIQIQDSKLIPSDILNLSISLESTCIARDLVNEPVNKLNAKDLANVFQKLGKSASFKTTVLNKTKIEQLKMGGLLAVNQGSVDEPTFTIMEYKPSNAKNKKPIVLIGKGVVYDTGGLSLKPTPNSMDAMKCDMAGGAVVGSVMNAIAKLKLNLHVIGLVPATDNRPGKNAFAPGDIITMMNGSTVEMLNSDAEGRMILADALHYAEQYKPELIIELSTLTGSAANAIGQFGIVYMGTASKEIKQKLELSGEQTHERLVEFPFWSEYDEQLKSDIADQKNIGGSQAGAITAGKFLAKFTTAPYLHLDIAGPAFYNVKDAYIPKGGTGYGVRLLINYLSAL